MRIEFLLTTALVTLVAGCAAPHDLPSTEVGTWRVAGSSGSLLRTWEMNSHGDRSRYQGELVAGTFIAPGLMLEVGVDAERQDFQLPDEDRNRLTEISAYGGLRYYFGSGGPSQPYSQVRGGRSLPYFGVGFGVSRVDFEVLGEDESDTSPALFGRAGFETFLSDLVALDVGLSLVHVFGRELAGVEEDVTELGFLIGLSVWF